MKNVGSSDKVIRIVIGLALLSLLIFLDGNNKYWGFYLGTIHDNILHDINSL